MAGIGSLYIVYKFIFRDTEEIPPLNEDQKIDDKNDLPNVVQNRKKNAPQCFPFENRTFGDFSSRVGPYEQDAGEDSYPPRTFSKPYFFPFNILRTFYSFLNIYAGTDNQRRDVQDTPLYKLVNEKFLFIGALIFPFFTNVQYVLIENPPPVDTRYSLLLK